MNRSRAVANPRKPSRAVGWPAGEPADCLTGGQAGWLTGNLAYKRSGTTPGTIWAPETLWYYACYQKIKAFSQTVANGRGRSRAIRERSQTLVNGRGPKPPPHVNAESPLEFDPMLLRLSTEETLIPKGMSGNKEPGLSQGGL